MQDLGEKTHVVKPRGLRERTCVYPIQFKSANWSAPFFGGGQMILPCLAAPAPLQTLVVNSTADGLTPVNGATLTLRDAIALADAAVGPVNITFSPAVFAGDKTIVLDGLPIDVLGNGCGVIAIEGPSAGLTLDAAGRSTVLMIESAAEVDVSNLRFTGGNNSGIINAGQLTLTYCTISGNASSNSGGGICDAGDAVVRYCTIANNTAYMGGGVELGAESATMTFDGVTFSGNSADSVGGGIYIDGGDATITNCTFSGNMLTGAISDGAAITNYFGSADIQDCTISHNGLDNEGAASLCTGYNALTTLANTVIAGTFSLMADGPILDVMNVEGSFNSLGGNFIGDADPTIEWTASDIVGSDANPIDPKLSTLGNSGGPTQTMVPLFGSPLLNAGSATLVPAGDAVDQRGLPRTLGGNVDIGAVEVGQAGPYGGTPPTFGVIQAENFDYGGQDVGYYDPANVNRGGLYRPSEGVGIGAIPLSAGGGYFVGWSQAGEVLNYTVDVTATGAYTLNFRLASFGGGARFHLNVDGVNVTGELSAPNTANWNAYQTLSKTGVQLGVGTHSLQLVIDSLGPSGAGVNFDWFSATRTG